ncbi:uncharacterized protein BO96DRAFT_349299 [Aspergillus niger CBS 101883]|uniref:Contig An18c0160, genomic contig n=2 Tax=Aspergillus niger TaxID=5061 RepID=A2RAY0_ASPNC|nr:uncharacterized protein BO96DRAFT_349299 [Aspergillus niger CBS 101883]XP_059602950.1 uncharacterized protein An18g04740 [Aspergillus niger]PYH51732.1 hypothetical protein BO96DRAFT_349299 [Aspergillus niger CBS 101883]CAK43276.1 unnamed protein product [Aspergillus niger]
MDKPVRHSREMSDMARLDLERVDRPGKIIKISKCDSWNLTILGKESALRLGGGFGIMYGLVCRLIVFGLLGGREKSKEKGTAALSGDHSSNYWTVNRDCLP